MKYQLARYRPLGATARRLGIPDGVADALVALAELPPGLRDEMARTILRMRTDLDNRQADAPIDYDPNVALDVVLQKVRQVVASDTQPR